MMVYGNLVPLTEDGVWQLGPPNFRWCLAIWYP